MGLKKALILGILALIVFSSLAYTIWWLEYGRMKAIIKTRDGTEVKVSGAVGEVKTLNDIIIVEGEKEYFPINETLVLSNIISDVNLIIRPPAKEKIVLKVKVEVDNWAGHVIDISFDFGDPSGMNIVWCPMSFGAMSGKWYTVVLEPRSIKVEPQPVRAQKENGVWKLYPDKPYIWLEEYREGEAGWLHVQAISEYGDSLRLYVQIVSSD